MKTQRILVIIAIVLGLALVGSFLNQDKLRQHPDKPTTNQPAQEPVKQLTPEEGRALQKETLAKMKEDRIQYGKNLRNEFLDRSLDIEVTVKGKNKDQLVMKYSLFNAVWRRKFETDNSLEVWKALGFKRVELTDGYNYGEYWTLYK